LFKKRLAGFRRRRILGRILELFPIAWNQLIERESLNINKLEQVLLEGSVDFSETCLKRRGAELCFGFFAKA
jgi:hypothetical protein